MVSLTHIVKDPLQPRATEPMKSPTRARDELELEHGKGGGSGPGSSQTLCGLDIPPASQTRFYQGEHRAGLCQMCNIAPRLGDCSNLVDLPA